MKNKILFSIFLLFTMYGLSAVKILNVNYSVQGGNTDPWLCFWCDGITTYKYVTDITKTELDGDVTITTRTITCWGDGEKFCPKKPKGGVQRVVPQHFMEKSIEMMNEHVETEVFTNNIDSGTSYFHTIYNGKSYYRSVTWNNDPVAKEVIINHTINATNP